MSKRNNDTTVNTILDDLDQARIEKENNVNPDLNQLTYDGNICTMVEERHEARDSWLTLLIEGVIISR
jgi:hypothetical protein